MTLTAAGLVTKLVPFRYWRRWVVPSRDAGAGVLSREGIADIAWAVERTSAIAPSMLTCLPRALAAELMLLRRGCRPAFRIGVRHEAGVPFSAHAWLELGGEVIVGRVPDLERFVRLDRWPSPR